MILVTCTISSFVTEKAARELVTKQQQDDYLKDKIDTGEERILIPIANPDTIENLVNLAILLKNPKKKTPLYAINVHRRQIAR